MTILYMNAHSTRGVTDMKVTVNIGLMKKRGMLLLGVALYSGIIWSMYCVSMPDITNLIESRSIVYYFWGCFIVILSVPGFCYLVFVFAFAIFMRDLQLPKPLAQGITLVFHYFGIVFIIGTLLSFIVLFYPLGTRYVFCERSGPFSGTYYTRTEAICEQVKYLQKTGAARDIQKLNDKLDGVSPH